MLAGAQHSEARVLPTYQRGPGTCANLHQAVFYHLHTSYLLSLLTKRPQAYTENALKSFTILCYLVRKFYFFSRQKTTKTNANTWILSHCFLTSPWCKIGLRMKTILIQFIFLSSYQSSIFQPFPPHRSSNSFPLMNCAAVLVLNTQTSLVLEYWQEFLPKITDLKDIYCSIDLGAHEVKPVKRKDIWIVLISSVNRTNCISQFLLQ